MSKRLNEEHEKYTEMFRDLKDISEKKRELEEDSTLIDPSQIVTAYKQELSISGISQFFSDWEADTPEEIETLKICKAVM